MSAATRSSYRRRVIQFVVLFCILSAGSSALETWMRARRVGGSYQAAIAGSACTVVRALGVDARVEPELSKQIIFVGNRQMVVTIECAAVLATGLFVSAVLAFPCPWRAKVVGVLVGVAGVGVLNLLRIMILSMVAHYKDDWFNLTHDVLMQGFLLIMVAPLWLLWLAWALKPAARSPKTH